MIGPPPELYQGALPGLDLDRFRSHFEGLRPGEMTGPLSARLLAGGKSNLTYEVTDGQLHWVVRRPPLGHVLATAHDMTREHRVITALQGSGVPVPATYLLCDDVEVLGAPFYVMERVEGTPYRCAAELGTLGLGRTEAISRRMIETLAALHDVLPAAVGLADFGRPDNFLERQVRRWGLQLDGSLTREVPGIRELQAWLEAHIPEQGSTAIVHGDYRLDNLLLDDHDLVTAVLDWEMATLGDPLTDLALLLVYHGLSRLNGGAVVTDVATAPGFLSDDQLLDSYATLRGVPLRGIGFHVGLAHFKLAVIIEGIHYRHLRGQTVGEGFDGVGELVEPLVAGGLAAVQQQG